MTHYLSNYAACQTKEQMDDAARKHADLHRKSMTDSDRAVFEMICRHSVNYLAAHLKHETFVTKLGLSNSTVRRAIRKLVKLGIIERIHYIRPVMNGLGANIYVILPLNERSVKD